jgi:hypothetical protein
VGYLNAREYQEAVVDPAGCFASPEEILARVDLSPAQKLHLLRRWRYDALELSIAAAEGMAGGEPSQFDRVSAALASLEQPALAEAES